MPPIIDYSSSDSEPEGLVKSKGTAAPISQASSSSAPAPASSSQLPPLPSSFHVLYPTAPRSSTSDDPTLHSGRTRQIPHSEGTWPSHIQLEWHPDPKSLDILNELLSTLKEDDSDDFKVEVYSLLKTPLGSPAPLHISLSKTLPIPTNRRAGFLADLEAGIGKTGVKSFNVKLNGGLEWASNEDGTRRFLIVKSGSESSGKMELRKLLEACNEVVTSHGLAKGLYADREDDLETGFHFSIAWSLGLQNTAYTEVRQENGSRKKRKTALGSELEDSSERLKRVWASSYGEKISEIQVPFDKVLARVGNAVHEIRLSRPKLSNGP